jgi:alkane 1-monooxygenase
VKSAPFLLIFTVPALVVAGIVLGGAWAFAVPLYVFIIVPVVDRILGDGIRNPDRSPVETTSTPHLVLLVVYGVVQLGVTAWCLVVVAGGMPVGPIVGLAVGLGISNGAVGITVAHEFIHRSRRWERGCGVALLATVCYAHFRIEHVQGHHATVGTPNDPATARRGQSVYAFWAQSVIGGVRSAWRIEARRLERMGKPIGSVRNRMIWYALLQIGIAVAIVTVLAPVALLVFLLQAFVAFSLLEIVNYVEHYGLERRHEGGRYARVEPSHSWDSPRRLTNYLLINLQRHADHHLAPQHRYHLLHHRPDAPRLPAGYAEMVLLALVPPAWFARIDPILEGYEGAGDRAASR